MKAKIITETTTNRYEYNRAYKHYLERKGKIKCSFCRYHEYENKSDKYYGEYGYSTKMTYPNWKLVSKNSKQWMNKPIRIIENYSRWGNYSEIIF